MQDLSPLNKNKHTIFRQMFQGYPLLFTTSGPSPHQTTVNKYSIQQEQEKQQILQSHTVVQQFNIPKYEQYSSHQLILFIVQTSVHHSKV